MGFNTTKAINWVVNFYEKAIYNAIFDALILMSIGGAVSIFCEASQVTPGQVSKPTVKEAGCPYAGC